MREWLEKYKGSEMRETNRKIDEPMILCYGVSFTDFSLGLAAGLPVLVYGNVFVSGILTIPTIVVVAIILREYRTRFPKNFLSHFFWSLGISGNPSFPSFFRKRRIHTFGP